VALEAWQGCRVFHARILRPGNSAFAVDWYDAAMTEFADQLIDSLALAPHPEGGHYRRIHASDVVVQHRGAWRPAMTAIQFLLRYGECSRWHRVDADEAWHWQDGGALRLQTYDPATGELALVTLGEAAHQPGMMLHVVRAELWQRAWTDAPFALVACTVAPGFVWEGFALLGAAPQVAGQLAALGAGEAG
jgi:predicted cupin superfamily sugar epimerase